MTNELSKQVAAILGVDVFVNTEDGVSIFRMDNCQLTMLGKAPKTISAEWVVNAIARKEKTAQDVKERREKAVALIRKYLTDKGLSPNGLSMYFTSFGFSVENLFRDGLIDAKKIVEEGGIAYKRMEYSGAHWVVRVIL